MQVGELFYKLGLKVESSGIDSFQKGLNSIAMNMLKVTGIFTAAAFAVDKFIDSSANNAVNLTNFNVLTGEATETLQRFQAAAKTMGTGVTAEGVTTSLMNLQNALNQFAFGTENQAPFTALGISAYNAEGKIKSLGEVLADLREAVRGPGFFGLSDQLKAQKLQDLGLDPRLIEVLKLSAEDFAKATDKFVLSPDIIQRNLEVAKSMQDLSATWSALKDSIVSEGAPALTSAMKALSDNLGRYIHNIGNVFTWMGDRTKDLSDWFDKFGKAGTTLKNVLMAIAGGIAIWFSPLVAIGASIYGIIAALNDLGKGPKSHLMQLPVKIAEGVKSGYKNLTEGVQDLLKPGSMKEFTENLKGFSDTSQAQVVGLQNSVMNGGTKVVNMTMSPIVNVHGAADPMSTAHSVVDVMNSHVQNMLNQALSAQNNGSHY